MTFLPLVRIVNPGFIALQVGHKYYKAFYDAKKNIIYVNSLYGFRFNTMLHEVGHWFICLLPHVDAVYRLNVLYDKLDQKLNQNLYII